MPTASIRVTGNVTQALAALETLGIKAEVTAAKTEASLGGAAMRTGNIFTKLGTTLGSFGLPFTAGLTRMGEKISEAESSAARLGATVGAVSRTVALAGGIGLAVAGVEAVKGATKFQQATTLLVTAAGEQQSKLQGVSDGILKISGQTGTGAEQLAEGMYTVEKAGYRAADGLNVLKMSAEGAKAENVDMATMTNAVTSVMTSYHDKASQATSVVNQMIAASGAAKTTMQEFAGALSTVLPVASAAGLSFAEVGGAIATLTQHGTSADESTQELANTIRGLQAPSQVAQKEMQQLGLNVTDLSTHLGERGLTGTLNTVVAAITTKMGPAGTVILDAFKKSQSASADLQTMLKSMPPSLADISQKFLSGTMGMKDYQTAVKGMGAQGYAMGAQFLALAKSADGFNELLKSGQPGAQTFAAALKAVMGGATGMNTALMLSGENMAGFKDRVTEISDAASKNGHDVSTWAKTQATFSVQLSQVKDGLEAVGIEAGEDLLPKLTEMLGVVQDGGHIFMDVAHVIGDIPGPIKSIGVEAAIAAVIFPKLAAGVAATGEALSLSALQMRIWASEATDSAGRARLLSAGIAGLGSMAKTAAGVGGMVALTQGVGHADTAIGGLETTAGAAALGFSMGGPWGAAIGGAAGLVFSLSKRVEDAQQHMTALRVETAAGIKVNVDKSAVESLITALEKAHGDYKLLDQDAKGQALNSKISVGQQSTVTSRTGLTSKTQADIYAGDPGAIKAGEKALSELSAKLDAFKDAQVQATDLQTWSSWGSEMSATGSVAAKDFDTWGQTVRAAFAAGSINAKTFAQDMHTVAAAQADGTESSQDHNRAMQMGADLDKAAGSAAKSYSDATKSLKTELGTGAQINDGYNASLRTLAISLGITVAQIQKMPKNVQSKIELDGAPQTTDQATQLLKDLGKLLTYKQLRSVIALDGVDLAYGQLTNYLAKVAATPHQVVTAYEAEGIKLTQQQVTDLQSKFKLTPKQVKVLMQADGIPTATKSIQGLGDVSKTAAQTVNQSVHKAVGTAQAGGPQVGGELIAGAIAGLTGGSSTLSAAAAQVIDDALASMRTAADSHSPSRKTKLLGHDMLDGLNLAFLEGHDSLGKAGTKVMTTVLDAMDAKHFGKNDPFSAAGQSVIDHLVNGMHSKQGALQRASNQITKLVQDTATQVQNATEWGQSFAGNMFSAGLAAQGVNPGASSTSRGNGMTITTTGASTTGLTGSGLLAAMLNYSSQQTTQDEQLLADITKLRKEGLNPSLISQMQAGGTSGLAEIDALAGASKGQIAQFNSLNARQNNALNDAGAYGTTGKTMAQLHKQKDLETSIERAIKRALKDGVKSKDHKKGRGTA